MEVITLNLKLEDIPILLSEVRQAAQNVGFTPSRTAQIELVVEELLANIFKHAYSGTGGRIEFSCEALPAKKQVKVVVSDWSKPFNIFESTKPDLDSDLDVRPIGGLGVHLIKKLTDEIHYKRIEGGNETVLIFCNKD